MPPKLHFIWAPGVPAELRKIERDTAMRILLALTRYARTGEGDVKALEGRLTGSHRLRVGGWRVRFRRLQGGAIYVIAVRNRGDAY
jgi:mRNA-degrading endonuclease RelE of RelBE toxin-antitoxin system